MRKKYWRIIINAAAIAVIFTAAIFLAKQIQGSETALALVRDFGYFGLFAISIISGFNLIFPIPAVSFLPAFVEAGLSFWTSIAVITLGMTIGDAIGFFIGKTGGRIAISSHHQKFVDKLHRLRDKNPRWPVLLVFVYASFAPIPNELLIIPLGFMGYKFKQIALPLVFGSAIFNTLAAHGVIQLFKLF